MLVRLVHGALAAERMQRIRAAAYRVSHTDVAMGLAEAQCVTVLQWQDVCIVKTSIACASVVSGPQVASATVVTLHTGSEASVLAAAFNVLSLPAIVYQPPNCVAPVGDQCRCAMRMVCPVPDLILGCFAAELTCNDHADGMLEFQCLQQISCSLPLYHRALLHATGCAAWNYESLSSVPRCGQRPKPKQ